MTFKQFVEVFAEEHGYTKEQSKKIIRQVFSTLGYALVLNFEVPIPGFGRFKMRRIEERTVRLPFSKDVTTIPTTLRAKLVPSGNLVVRGWWR